MSSASLLPHNTDNSMGDEKLESVHTCPICERELFRPPHKRARYWILSVAIHILTFVIVISLIHYIHLPTKPQKKPQIITTGEEHNAHLVGTPWSPLNGHEQWKMESLEADGWNSKLFFGEPTYESDWAWINLTWPRSFRLNHEEAARLNLTDSVMLDPGDDYGTMLGVMHNLHCLRRIRQMMYSDYYYPDAPEDRLEHNRVHGIHCLESIRKSIMCYPDLNPHPYFWSGMKYHDITVSAKVTRKCVNWEALQHQLKPRDFEPKMLMKGTGPES